MSPEREPDRPSLQWTPPWKQNPSVGLRAGPGPYLLTVIMWHHLKATDFSVEGQGLNHNTQEHPYDYKQSAEMVLDLQVETR